MVVKEEACCPKCFTYNSFVVPLKYREEDGSFICSQNPQHVFIEDEEGFLMSKE